jgi:hypothetical protein
VDLETGDARPLGLKTAAPVNDAGAGGRRARGGLPPGYGYRMVTGITYAPDGRSVLLAGYEGSLSLWDLTTGKLVRQLTTFDLSRVQAMAPQVLNDPYFAANPFSRTRAVLSPDGRTVAAYGLDGVVRVLETSTGAERCRFDGHEGAVTALAFSSDGKTLATASTDTTALLWDVTRPTKEAPRATLTAAEVEGLWADLGSEDGGKAYRALLALAAAPKQAVPFLNKQLKPAEAPDTKTIPGLIADLDSDEYAVRKKAEEELQKLGEIALPALKKLLEEKPPLDVARRVEAILRELDTAALTPEQVRDLRAVEALEHAGTAEARQVLEVLARGAPEGRLTQDARAALGRLAKRAGGRS